MNVNTHVFVRLGQLVHGVSKFLQARMLRDICIARYTQYSRWADYVHFLHVCTLMSRVTLRLRHLRLEDVNKGERKDVRFRFVLEVLYYPGR